MRYRSHDLYAPIYFSRRKGLFLPMVSLSNSSSRSIDQLGSCVTPLSVLLSLLSITALGQTRHIILGIPQIHCLLPNNSSGAAEHFPATANSSGQVDPPPRFLGVTLTRGDQYATPSSASAYTQTDISARLAAASAAKPTESTSPRSRPHRDTYFQIAGCRST